MNAPDPPVHGPQDAEESRQPSPGAGALTKPGAVRLAPPRQWDLWQQRRRVVVYVLVGDAVVLALAAASVFLVPFHDTDLLLGVPLLIVALTYIEATRPIERLRERAANVPHVDLNSTWTFAAALLLHPVLVAALVAVIYTQRWLRIRHHYVYRQAFSAAVTILSEYAAMAILVSGSRWLDLPRFADAPRTTATSVVVLAAGVTYLVANVVLIGIAIHLREPGTRLSKLVPSWEGETFELGTVGMAVLVAWSLADWPAAVLLLFGLSYLLHDRVLFPQLRRAANTDAMTGLLNHGAWCTAAAAELAHATEHGKPCVVLVIDLDEFKRINDTYGHLVGDAVLVAVSGVIASELRQSDVVGRLDLVGRFGGEEFVVLLAGASHAAANTVAERIRYRVSQVEVAAIKPHTSTLELVGVTCSIGVALHPDHGANLNDLIAAADRAMYAAKQSGRDQVRHSHRYPPPRSP